MYCCSDCIFLVGGRLVNEKPVWYPIGQPIAINDFTWGPEKIPGNTASNYFGKSSSNGNTCLYFHLTKEDLASESGKINIQLEKCKLTAKSGERRYGLCRTGNYKYLNIKLLIRNTIFNCE